MAAGSGAREGRMTGLAESIRAAEDSGPREVTAPPEPAALPAPVSRDARRVGWDAIGGFACGVAGSLTIAWFIFSSRGEIGSKAEWFFGAVVFCVVMVTMWQILTIQRQANQTAVATARRLRPGRGGAEGGAGRETGPGPGL